MRCWISDPTNANKKTLKHPPEHGPLAEVRLMKPLTPKNTLSHFFGADLYKPS